ncbi:hypothetical protein TSAR_003910, partial [Trichomalopsis sarcophagae]
MTKPVFFLFAVFAVALAQPITNGPAAEEAKASIQVQAEPTLTLQNKKPTVGQIVDRLAEAVRLTIIEERESIAKALNSIREAGGKGVKAGLDAAATGFDIFLVVPKFGRNVLVSSANIASTGQTEIKGQASASNIDAATFRGLIEVGSDGTATDNRKGNKGFGDALPFGQSNPGKNIDDLIGQVFGGDNGDGDGIKIDGPKISGSVGKGTAEIEAKQDTEDKVIDEKWRPFFDPNNKNIFGQTFPAPEEVPKIPKRPGMNFPEPEPERPITGGHGGHESNGGFEIPSVETDASINGGHGGNVGFQQQSQGHGEHAGNGGFEQQNQGHAGNGGFEVTESWNNGGHSGNGGFEQQTQEHAGHGGFEVTESWNNDGHSGNGGFEQQTQGHSGHAGNGGFEVTESWNNGGHSGNGGFEQQTQGHSGHTGNGGFEVTDESWNNGGHSGNGGFEQQTPGHGGNGGFVVTESWNNGGHAGNGGLEVTESWNNGGHFGNGEFEVTENWNNGGHLGNGGFVQGGDKDNSYEQTEASNGHGGHGGHGEFDTNYPCNGNKHGGIIGGILGGWKDKLHGCTETNNGYEDKTESSNGHRGHNGHGGFETTYPCNGNKHGGIIGGILGGWKDKLHGCTESNNGYEDKTENSNGHNHGIVICPTCSCPDTVGSNSRPKARMAT